MANENFQNTAEIKLQSTTEIKLQNTGDLKSGSDSGYDNFFEPTTRKEKIISIIVCVVIAFIIWLIIANINLKASTPAPLPLSAGAENAIASLSEQVWVE